MSDMEQTPELSVIMIVGEQRARAARALASLLAQSAIDRMEILLMDLGPATLPPLAGSGHPRVRLTRPRENILFAAARAAAARMARAPAIAFIEEHCEARPGWAEALIVAHRDQWGGVASAFENGNPGRGRSNSAFRMTYGSYLPSRGVAGPTTWMAGHNSSYKRDILLGYGDDLDELLKADLALHNRMLRDGHQFFFEPAAVIAHHNDTTMMNLSRGVFDWNFCYSAVEARLSRWTGPRRIGHALRACCLPWVRLARGFGCAARRGRADVIDWVRDIPFFFVVSCSSAAGQVAGAFCDMAKAEKRFSDMEMNAPRGRPEIPT